MTAAPDAVLATVLGLAMSATAAEAAWVVTRDGDKGLRVLVAAGAAAGTEGRQVPGETGTAAYAISSGQPLAVAPREGDDLGATAVAVTGRQPTSVLSVPCEVDGTPVGALELVDKSGGGRFSFDDVEVVTMLAEVASAALAGGGIVPDVPGPEELTAELHRLAVEDPTRYATVAAAVEAMLSGA